MAGILLNSTNYSGGGGQTIQKTELPVASAAEEGNIYQFIGETDDYVHGQFYECVEVDGSDPVEYEWVESEVEHELTAGEFAEIMTPLPGTPDEGVVIDLRGNERVIGKLIESDGTEKVLYEKVVDCGTLPNSTSKEVAHGISNISKIVYVGGYAKNPTAVETIPLPFINNAYLNWCILLRVLNDKVNIMTSVDFSGYTESYVTLRYTKTTD